jgi:hypothetical protein
MDDWRERALQLFPEMHSEIQSAESVGTLWIELASRFHRHYGKSSGEGRDGSPKLIRAICLYAIWCTRSDFPDTQQAAWIEFYENLPRFALQCEPTKYKAIVNDLVANIGIDEIEKSAGTIGAYMKPGQIDKFLADARLANQERQRNSRKR